MPIAWSYSNLTDMPIWEFRFNQIYFIMAQFGYYHKNAKVILELTWASPQKQNKKGDKSHFNKGKHISAVQNHV
jgi:hypothetical protein